MHDKDGQLIGQGNALVERECTDIYGEEGVRLSSEAQMRMFVSRGHIGPATIDIISMSVDLYQLSVCHNHPRLRYRRYFPFSFLPSPTPSSPTYVPDPIQTGSLYGVVRYIIMLCKPLVLKAVVDDASRY